jgi:hypothetical protein
VVGLEPKRLLTRELARFFDLEGSLLWEFLVWRRKSVRKEPWESEGMGSEMETMMSSVDRWRKWLVFEDDDKRIWRRCLWHRSAARAIPSPQKRPEKKPAATALPGKEGQLEVKDADVWLNPGSADVNIGETVAGETLIIVAEVEVEDGDVDEADEDVVVEAALSVTQILLF